MASKYLLSNLLSGLSISTQGTMSWPESKLTLGSPDR